MVKALEWLGQRTFNWIHQRHLVYASCWEDPAIDRRAMRLTGQDRVLVITSAGCNALDYLLDEPASIHAVDINYRQNALLELKRAAILNLEWAEFFQLFGEGRAPDAKSTYRKRLRAHLPPVHQEFWDRWIGLFSGPQSFYFRTPSGQFARWFRWWIDHVLGVGRDIDELLEAESVEEQRTIYERRLQKKLWSHSLGWLMRRHGVLALSGIPPQQRRQLLSSFPDVLSYLRQRAEHVIMNLPLKENYFWRVYLTGGFTPTCCPAYLKPENFQRLQHLLPRLTTHTATVADYLRSTNERFSHYVLLDHMDWLAAGNSVALQQEWQGLIDRAADGACFLWRSLGLDTRYVDDVVVSHNGHNQRVRELLRYDQALSDQLYKEERVSVYGCLRIAQLSD